MSVYRKLYTLLFNAITDALEQLSVQNYGNARDILICAQQQSEEAYMETARTEEN